MIVAENLSRRYDDFTAVDDVSFKIGSGEVVGLLGHNGAGKTTIMKMLTGYLEPSQGRVLINKQDISEDRDSLQADIGYLPENCPVYPEMTVIGFLDYMAELRRIPLDRRNNAVRKAIRSTRLEAKAAEPISALSRGLRQRVGVAQAVIHEPKIVILDEPTNGLDPTQIQQMRALVRELSQHATVIISTHILQEVQAVCDRVIMINRGKLALDQAMDEIRGAATMRVTTNGLDPDAWAQEAKRSIPDLELRIVITDAEQTVFDISSNKVSLEGLGSRAARSILDSGASLYALEPRKHDLETVFATLSTGMDSAGEQR